MKKILAYFFVISAVFFHCSLFSQAQSHSPSSNSHSQFVTKDPFGGRAFIENKGQFKDMNSSRVLFALDNGFERIYFTQKGLVYELTKVYPLNEREREAIEKGKPAKPNKLYFVNMSWIGANPGVTLEAAEKQSYYVTYGEKELNASTFKKITYKNVYSNIDIEYTIPQDKDRGIKYSLVIHPGANPGDVKIIYSGVVDKIRFKDNEVIIKTPLEDIIEHAPESYYTNGLGVPSALKLNEDTLGFDFMQSYENDKTLVVDPWVATTATLTTNNYGYDVDYDFLGNTYIYGGVNPFKVACYNSAGTLQWVFSGLVSSQGWSSAPISTYASNFGIDKFISKTYIGQGFVSTGNRIIRLDANGNYDNFINSSNSSFQEVWDMGFHCTTAEVFVLGGGTSSNISAVTMNSVSAGLTLSTFQPLTTSAGQDVVSHAIDDAANIFVISAGNSAVNNKLCLVNSTFNGNIWTQASGYTSFSELGNKSQYSGAGVTSNGFNALAVNANYLFYYDGLNLAAYNKSTGAVVTSTTVSGNTLKQVGGIAVDDCNNLYVGGNGSIITYGYNGTTFTPLTPISLNSGSTSQYIYDIQLDKQSKLLYVCGSGFAGVYSPVPTLACTTASSACLFSQGGINVTTTSVTCASLGSATCSSVGGIGPFTYTWLPSMQSGSVATGLNPGTHGIIVHDAGTGNTYTATTYLSPLVAFTGTVSNPLVLNCHGVNNATATVSNISGGSGNQYYLWTDGINTQTTAIATGLGLGNYSVSVIDALTSCAINQTFAVTQPPAVTLNVSASSPSACANTSITLTPLIAGGTPGYSYSWTAGPATGTYAATQSLPGNHIYTLTAFDSKSCATVYTISLNYINTPTLTLNTVSICPQTTGTLNVSGANTYTWSNNTTGATFTDNPLTTTLYSVVGSGSLCNASASASIVVMPIPSPTLTSNSPVCNGYALQMNGFGGVSYLWSGPLGFTSTLQQPLINPVTPLNSGIYSATVTAANSCTAAASQSLLVRTPPIIAALGSTVCVTQTLNLTASSSFTGCSYFWTGPNSFTSSLQNPFINTPAVNRSGSYTLVVTDQNNCNSSAVAHVTVTAMPVPSFTTSSPLCYGKTLILNASATTGGLFFNWAGPNGFSSTTQTTQINNVSLAANGNYSLVVTEGPCITGTIHPVTVYPLPTLAIQGYTNICETKTLSLNVIASNNVISYSWSGPFGLTGSSPAITRSPVQPAFSGIYAVTVSDTNACSNTATTIVNILLNPVLVAPDMTVCLHDPVTLHASGAASYWWTGPGFYQSAGANALIASANYISPVFYTVVGTAANTCTSTTQVNLKTRPLPKPSLSILPGTSLCLNDKVNFTAYGGNSYQWRGPDNIYYEGKLLSLNVSGIFYSGTYTLTALDSVGCRASVDTALIVHELPTGSLLQDKTQSCVPFCSDFYFSPYASTHITAKWQINNKIFAGTTFSYCFNQVGTSLVKGLFYDTVTTCANSMDFNVIVYPKPKADFTYSPDKPVENMDAVIFTNSSQGEEINKFSWFFISNSGYTSTSKNTSYLFENEGSYPVTMIATNKWGCADTAIKVIKVDPDFTIFVPDAFTPNSDGKNEVFLPVSRGVKLYHLAIFDRWGALIFETNNTSNGWDGTYKRELCKSDVYVWRITISGNNGDSKELNGHVILYK